MGWLNATNIFLFGHEQITMSLSENSERVERCIYLIKFSEPNLIIVQVRVAEILGIVHGG